MKALLISADQFEDSELLYPLYRLREEGIAVDVVSTRAGNIVGKHGYEVAVTRTLDDVKAGDYDLLILPGGKAPAEVRGDKRAVELVRDIFNKNKPVAAICHGPQVLVTAGLLKGRRATCYRTVVPELEAAGAVYEDREVVVDGTLVTSRQPSDLPAFMRETMKLLGKSGARRTGAHEQAA